MRGPAQELCWLIHWHVKVSSQVRTSSLEMDKGRNFLAQMVGRAQAQVDCGLDESGKWQVL